MVRITTILLYFECLARKKSNSTYFNVKCFRGGDGLTLVGIFGAGGSTSSDRSWLSIKNNDQKNKSKLF